MPFTASHPAAILPLLRVGVPASALVIGSVVPDLPYYAPLPLTHAQTHSLASVVGVDLVVGLAAFVVWHAVLVAPLLWVSPAGLQRRIPEAWRSGLGGRVGSVRAVALVAVGLVIGALTHVVWDAFTHAGMWGVERWPWLATPVLGLAAFRWLHVLSSVVGLLALGWVVARWWRRAPVGGPVALWHPGLIRLMRQFLAIWVLLATVEIAVGLVRSPSQFLREQVVITGLTDFLTGLVGFVAVGAVAWHAVRAWRPAWVGLGPGATARRASAAERGGSVAGLGVSAAELGGSVAGLAGSEPPTSERPRSERPTAPSLID